MAKKKWWRIIVAMICKECWSTNYFSTINKAITPKLELKKYCKKCKKQTTHNSKEKLK